MRTGLLALLTSFAVCLPAEQAALPAAAQESTAAVPILSVCEALTGLSDYRGRDIVIVGDERWTFEGWFLVGDCQGDDKVALQGQRWPVMIAVHNGTARGKAQPDLEKAISGNEKAIQQRLEALKGYPPPPRPFEPEGKPRILMEMWAALYGRLEAPDELKPPQRMQSGNGYGANGSVPAAILETATKMYASR